MLEALVTSDKPIARGGQRLVEVVVRRRFLCLRGRPRTYQMVWWRSEQGFWRWRWYAGNPDMSGVVFWRQRWHDAAVAKATDYMHNGSVWWPHAIGWNSRPQNDTTSHHWN